MKQSFRFRKIHYVLAATVLVALVIFLMLYFLLKPITTIRGAVVTNGRGCSAIGNSILDSGGSVADAAIAALFCEGVSMPFSMGLGGGFLLTIYDRQTGLVESLDAREKAPAGAHENMFNGSAELSLRGGLSAAVPGELRGYWALYKKYGYLPWRELVEPTIQLCRNGIYVTAYLARNYREKRDLIYADPVLRDIFFDPDTNDTYVEGQYVKRLRLARTLEVIANEGGDALYTGSLVESLVKDIESKGGIITVEDMKNYTPIWQEPITTRLNGNYTVHTTPLPGSGVILTFILNILDGFLNATQPYSTETFQRIVESFKFGYGKRTELGDSLFVEGIEDLVANLTSKSYADEIRKQISDTATSNDASYYGAKTTLTEDHGTAQVSVLAPNGDAISVTSTINQVFGAGFASNSTGIILNDEMDDFSSPSVTNGFGIPPSAANYIKPNKRPLSSMVPSIILKDNDVVLVTGAAGGTKITTVVAQVIVKHLWFGIDLKDAIEEKRIHHQLFPMQIELEEGFDDAYPDVVRDLVSFGHNFTLTPTTNGFSALTSISAKDGNIVAAFDSRRGGYVTYNVG
ncbi:glutathione hydrolase 1 proenzyme-like [Cylas formicarius]|uniref:glutathione hydrolase 1 proenzyme-like n=1 Tax=Cylas formicarius TaxID=197179 RepID=UPI002958C7AA|nr:glutathione hydrolase 1 proenzyme-like [Cylas formicarius]